MEKDRRPRTLLIIVIVIILLLLALLLCRGCSGSTDTPSTDVGPAERSSAEPSPTESASPETADLVGRWEGSSSVLGDFSIIIERTAPLPDADGSSQYVSGYIVFGADPSSDPVAPLSGTANSTEEGLYDVQIWSTNLKPPDDEQGQTQPILFTGSLGTKEGEGGWESGEESGDWQVAYQAGENPDSPTFDLETSGLRIDFDVMGAVQTTDQNGTVAGQQTQLDVFTNIATSMVVVQLPGGSEITLDRETDIFSPEVDFVSEFRFAGSVGELPGQGQYVFRFLDPMGEPLNGIEGVDVWNGCEALAPLNVRGSVGANGISVSWSSVPGFDPANPTGYYQIELGIESGEGKSYGSNHIHQTSHLLPFASFVPGTVGTPDGLDYGAGLGELVDGSYSLVVMVYFPANNAAGGVGFECQVSAMDEIASVEKTGGSFEVNK